MILDDPNDPNKLIRNFFMSDHKNTAWKDAAEEFAKFIQQRAVDALPEKANPLDIAMFKQGMKGIREGFVGIANVLDASQSNRIDEAYMHLRYLIASVYILGQSAVMSPKMKKVWLSEFQSEKGKKSGISKKKEAAETWQPHALELAKEIRDEERSIRQIPLATKIREKWRLKIKCVSVGRLVRYISKWEDEGKLTKAVQ